MAETVFTKDSNPGWAYVLGGIGWNKQNELFHAAKTGYIETLGKTDIRRFVCTHFKFNGQFRSPLEVAIENDNLTTFKPLIDEEMLTTPEKGTRFTPLHYAAVRGYLNLVLDLIDPRCLLLPDISGSTPLNLVICAGKFASIKDSINPNLLITPLITTHIGETTILGILKQLDKLDTLLECPLPETAKEITGEDWWTKHTKLIIERKKLEKAPEEHEIDLF